MARMSHVVLARKYRPRSFDQMVGQPHVVQALRNALEQQRLHHAYLFTGTRGIGKTTISRILAKSLNCTGTDGQGGITAHPCGVCPACVEIDADRYIDYIELDAASNRGIAEVQDLIERAAYKPGVGRFKVFMIDEAHQLTKDAFNALLKTLEEPPAYLKFVLATTDPEKMLPTVLSRCLQFNLRPMAPELIQEYLRKVLAEEGVDCDNGALRLLGRAARGSMRDALSLTDQAIAYGAGRCDEATVRSMLGAVDRSHAVALLDALAARDGVALLAGVDVLRAQGLSASATLDEMAALLQQAAIEQAVPGALDEADPQALAARALAAQLAADELQLAYSMAVHGREELRLMGDEYGALTMILLRFLAFPSQAAPTERTRTARPQALRAPAPASLAVAPRAAAEAEPVAGAAAPERGAQGDRWHELVGRMLDSGSVTALARELALQSELLTIDDDTTPPRWRLRVPRDSLRSAALADKLAAAIGDCVGAPVMVELSAGATTDSPAQRAAAVQEQRQQRAQQSIEADPLVRELLDQFPGSRIVPGSIKPASSEA